MKKIVLICICFMVYIPYHFSQSAGNLQFNRVILVGASADTVPVGKIWKIESVLSSNQLAPGLPANNVAQEKTNILQIKINTNVIAISAWLENVYSSYRGHSAFGQITELPIWLPAGTSVENASNATYISILEFNIIP